MSWLKDVEDKRNQKEKQEKELAKRQEAEVRSLDSMVCRLLDDVGMAKWGQFFSWDLLFRYGTLPGYIKWYKVEPAKHQYAGWGDRWSVTGKAPSVYETTYTVKFILGNPATGTANHFEVYEESRKPTITADTSESELKKALKKVVFG